MQDSTPTKTLQVAFPGVAYLGSFKWNSDTPCWALHVGKIDGTTTRGSSGKWNATVTITAHTAAEAGLASVTISGAWSNGATGTASCKLNATGRCTVTLNNIASASSTVTFTVKSLTLAGYVYSPNSNHDPDGSSNGASIVLKKP